MRPALSMTGRADESGEAGAVEGGGHGEEAEFGAEQALEVEAECHCEVAFERALVDFVEDDRGDAVERRVGLEAAHEEALGDDLDAGGVGDGALEAGAEADGLADGLADELGHAGGGGAGGEAAGFEHHDAAVAAPGSVEQGEGDGGRLAGTGRCDEDSVRRLR